MQNIRLTQNSQPECARLLLVCNTGGRKTKNHQYLQTYFSDHGITQIAGGLNPSPDRAITLSSIQKKKGASWLTSISGGQDSSKENDIPENHEAKRLAPV